MQFLVSNFSHDIGASRPYTSRQHRENPYTICTVLARAGHSNTTTRTRYTLAPNTAVSPVPVCNPNTGNSGRRRAPNVTSSPPLLGNKFLVPNVGGTGRSLRRRNLNDRSLSSSAEIEDLFDDAVASSSPDFALVEM